jgi:hypothetical protein
MQLDLLDFGAVVVAVIVAILAIAFIITIWSGALGSPLL